MALMMRPQGTSQIQQSEYVPSTSTEARHLFTPPGSIVIFDAEKEVTNRK